jgi:hypothetical protein
MGLMVRGMPAFYINGLIAAPNYRPLKGLDENRTINREQFDYSKLHESLSEDSYQRQVLDEIKHLLDIRSQNPAFSPEAKDLEIMDLDNDKVIAIKAASKDSEENIIGIFNISNATQKLELDANIKNFSDYKKDIIKGKEIDRSMELPPYQYLWIK